LVDIFCSSKTFLHQIIDLPPIIKQQNKSTNQVFSIIGTQKRINVSPLPETNIFAPEHGFAWNSVLVSLLGKPAYVLVQTVSFREGKTLGALLTRYRSQDCFTSMSFFATFVAIQSSFWVVAGLVFVCMCV